MPPTTQTVTCPWCGKPEVDPVANCPGCHRSPAQHPSHRRAQGGDAGAGSFEFELGSIPPPGGAVRSRAPASTGTALDGDERSTDAELPPGGSLERFGDSAADASAPADGAAVQLPAADESSGPSAVFGGLDGEDDEEEVAALDVELATGGSTEARPPKKARAKPTVGSAPASSQPETPPTKPTPAPLEALPATDPSEVLALAKYGAAPKNILGAVPYAWRVLKRRSELRRLLATAETTNVQLGLECRRRYADMLEQLRQAHRDDSELQELVAGVDQAHSIVKERTAQLEQSQQQIAKVLGEVDEQLASLARDRTQLEAERREALIRFEACAQERDRAQAQVKRTEIQLRALHDAAREAAGKGAKYAPPEHARQIASVEAERTELSLVLKRRQQTYDQAREALRVQDAALRELDRRTAALQAKRKGAEREGSQQEALQAEGVQAAEQQRLERCEKVIQQLMAERHPGLDAPMRKEIHEITARLRTGALDLETHRQAVDAFDRPAVRNGVVIVGAAALVLIAVVAVLI